MKKIAITGGIGSGKSEVAKIFQSLGIPVVDADLIARKLREPGQPAHEMILKKFGTVDRALLRAIVASDPKAKQDLERILHPLIQKASEQEFRKIESSSLAPFLLYEAALIIEAGRAKDFDGLMVVTAPESEKMNRIMARDQVAKEAALAMINAQMSDENRTQSAHHVIKNEGSLEELAQKVKKLFDQLKQS